MKQGFSLVELMVIIVIMGVLAGVAVPKFQQVSEKRRAIEYLKTQGISEEDALKIAVLLSKSTDNIRDTLQNNPSLYISYTAEESLSESDKTVSLSPKEIKILKSLLSLNSGELDQAISQSKYLSREEKSSYFGSSDSTSIFLLKLKIAQ